MKITLTAEKLAELKAKSIPFSVFTEKIGHKKFFQGKIIFLNARFVIEDNVLYLFLKTGLLLKQEVEQLHKILQDYLKDKIKSLSVYQFSGDDEKNSQELATFRRMRTQGQADIWEPAKLFDLTGTNKHNELVELEQTTNKNLAQQGQEHIKQALKNNITIVDPKAVEAVKKDKQKTQQLINNLTADLQMEFHYRTPLKKQIALLTQQFINAYNQSKHKNGTIDSFSIAVNYSMSNRQFKDEYGHRKSKANIHTTGKQAIITDDKNKEITVKTNNNTTQNSEADDTLAQILQGLGIQEGHYSITSFNDADNVSLFVSVELSNIQTVQNFIQQNIPFISSLYTKGKSELSFNFEVNELEQITAINSKPNNKLTDKQIKKNNTNKPLQVSIVNKTNSQVQENSSDDDIPVVDTSKLETQKVNNTQNIQTEKVDNKTSINWNDLPDEDDASVGEFNMVASEELLQQLSQQLNQIATNNNQNVDIQCEIKKNILIITLTVNEDEEQSILNYYNKYKQPLVNTIHHNFATLTFDDVEFKAKSLQAKEKSQQNAIEQQINGIFKQHLAGLKSFDLTYQYNILKANYGSAFRMNVHLINAPDNVNAKLTDLRNIFKDKINDLERVRINNTPHLLNAENLSTIKVHIPQSPVAKIINPDDFKDFELNNNFKFDILSEDTIDDVSDLDFKKQIVTKRKDPLQTYIIKFEGEDTPAASFTAKSGKEWDKMMFLASDKNNIPFKVSLFGSWPEKTNKALNKLSHGDILAAQGKFGYDKFNKTNLLSVQSLQLLSKKHIIDNSNAKGRYELHSHSKMSQLASINNADDLIDKAVENGFGGIAFTDDTSSQAYPKLINAQGKFKEFKPIFGTELNMITNKPTFVHNPNNIDFVDPNTTYVAFDIETTGFALRYNDIIELSMVKYKPKKEVIERGKNKGKVNYVLVEIDHDRQLVKTNHDIPQAVLDLTKITKEDLNLNGISIEQALQNFVNFISDDNTILIGHNVHFDIDFINQKLKENHFKYQIDKEKEVLDTLTIARRFVPNKRAYNLTALSKTLKIHLEQAHTAVYDAQATGFVWMALYNIINENNNVKNGNDLFKLEENNEHAYQEGFSNTFSALAINQKGIKNIYRMISVASTQHFYREAKLYPFEIKENHKDILLGSGGYNSLFWKYAYEKTIKKAKKLVQEMQYDYLEIAPFEAYGLPEFQRSYYEDTVKQILKLGADLNIPVIAITDTHQLSNEHFDNLAYEILVSKDKVPTTKLNRTPFYTTEELFKQFNFLDKITEQNIIVDNTVKLADKISNDIKPIVTDVTPPHIDGADEQLRKQTMERAYELYGNPLPKEIQERVETELNFIIKGGYAVHYIVAQKVVKESEKMGYLVGSRGSVGSSIVAFLMGITEVNALPAHYRSKHGDYFEWTPNYADGWDLPPKQDPNHPGEMLVRDGHNIPFSTFLGLKGTKVPDIDLNTSPEVQGKLQLFLKHYFGADHTIRVGTITGLAQGNTKMFVRKYEDSRSVNLTPAEISELQLKLAGVKQTTGQHPAGIMIVPDDKDILDYTPYNYPSNKPGEWITTHYVASDMHDALLKMDVLGHGDPSVLHMLQKLTGVNPHKIDVSDPKIIELFTKNDVDGLPEFDTPFARGILKVTKPTKFSDLVQISGLSHGTNVWEGNAKELIENEGKTLNDVIGNRDKIVLDLLKHHLDIQIADGISKVVKKGKPLKPEVVQAMRDHDVPEWYINSLKKITYLYPKAHAAAYVMSALRIAYFKVYYPIEFYATIMTYRPNGFDIEALCSNDISFVKDRIDYYTKKAEDYDRKESSDKPKAASLRMALHAMEHGAKFDMPSLKKSDATEWLIDAKHKNHIIVPLEAMDGFGIGAAESAVKYRNEHNGQLPSDLKIVKDKQNGMGLNKSVLTTLENMNLIHIETTYKDAYTKTGKKKKHPDKIQTITYK